MPTTDSLPSDDEILIVDDPGPRIGPSNAVDLVAQALESGAQGVAISVDRLDPDFFDLRTGIAGEVVQKFVTYRFPLVIVGALPPEAAGSTSFAAFVRETNRGTQLRFVDSMEQAVQFVKETASPPVVRSRAGGRP